MLYMSYSDNYSTSIELESDFNMFSTEMAGGEIKMVGGKSEISNDSLKQIVFETTKILANTTKTYYSSDLFKEFNNETQFLNKYNYDINKVLMGEKLVDLNDRQKMKKILYINYEALELLKNIIALYDAGVAKLEEVKYTITVILG